MTLRNLAQLFFWGCVALVTTLSLLPPPELPSVDIWDKAAHSIAYGALMLLGGIGYRLRLSLQQIALLLFVFGVAIEIIQYRMPGREFSLQDMLANAIGIVAFLPLILPAERLFRIRQS